MRPHSQYLKHPPDRPLFDQLPGIDGALGLQPLAEADHIFAAGLPDGGLRGVELFERNQRRFVGEVVLARFHHPDSEGGPVAGHAGAGHQFHLRVLQNPRFGVRRRGLRIRLAVCGDFFRIGIVDPLQGRARFEQPVGHAVDMAVVKTDRRKHEFSGFHHRVRLADRGVIHTMNLHHSDR